MLFNVILIILKKEQMWYYLSQKSRLGWKLVSFLGYTVLLKLENECGTIVVILIKTLHIVLKQYVIC